MDEVRELYDVVGKGFAELLASLPQVEKVANEIRRTSPVVPVSFGKAREDFELAGHRVPKGWMVLWGVNTSHMRPEIYPDPERFDPERFSPERAEHRKHPCAFAPNGAGDAHTGHKCAGYEFAPLFLKTFLIELARAYDYTIAPGQDLSRDWTKIPPRAQGRCARHRPKGVATQPRTERDARSAARGVSGPLQTAVMWLPGPLTPRTALASGALRARLRFSP